MRVVDKITGISRNSWEKISLKKTWLTLLVSSLGDNISAVQPDDISDV